MDGFATEFNRLLPMNGFKNTKYDNHGEALSVDHLCPIWSPLDILV